MYKNQITQLKRNGELNRGNGQREGKMRGEIKEDEIFKNEQKV